MIVSPNLWLNSVSNFHNNKFHIFFYDIDNDPVEEFVRKSTQYLLYLPWLSSEQKITEEESQSAFDPHSFEVE